MAPENATALVLKVVEFSETSSVVTLFTREFGKVRALAKGARRPKGPFESALDLLSLCRVVLLRKSSDALDLLTEAKLERRFRPPGSELSNLYAAYYVAELLNELTNDSDPHPALFDAANETLAALLGQCDASLVLVRFELAALAAVGHLPSLENCAECGTRVERTTRVPFSQWSGGVLCKSCRSGARAVVSTSAGVIETLARLAASDGDSWRQVTWDRRIQGELRAVLNHYWSHLLGHEPRMQRYLKA